MDTNLADKPNAQQAQPVDKKATLEATEQIRDLFARAHDYLAQATFPGHMGSKVAEVLNFLAFQHGDFKTRAERLSNELKNTVDVEAVKAATTEVLTGSTLERPTVPQVAQETPKV